MMVSTDPNATHRLTTAAVPEWAEVATGDARDAEIARLRETLAVERAISNGLSTACCKLKIELVDVKAECCRLTDDNGDLASELVHRDAEYACLVRAAQDVVNAYENGGMITPIGELIEALAALGKAKESR